MNGIGNAFIWAAIASGPAWLIFLGIAALEKKLGAARRYVPARVAMARPNMVRNRSFAEMSTPAKLR